MGIVTVQAIDPADQPVGVTPGATVHNDQISRSRRRIQTIVALGDSTPVGIGDPLADGGWRGFATMLADAVGDRNEVNYANLAFTGARAHCVRTRQLPEAVRLRPDAATVLVGMNDTLRSDFDPTRVHDDLDATVRALTGVGSVVLTARYHDHSRIFRLPGPLNRALRVRIAQLNAIIEVVSERYGAACLDLHALPGVYDLANWAVDRLHPSEVGHRLLAGGFARLLGEAGCSVPNPVSTVCSGGMRVTSVHHAGWLMAKALPWLWRRGRDLLPFATSIIWREFLGRPQPAHLPFACADETACQETDPPGDTRHRAPRVGGPDRG